jgi:hypothetical protein
LRTRGFAADGLRMAIGSSSLFEHCQWFCHTARGSIMPLNHGQCDAVVFTLDKIDGRFSLTSHTATMQQDRDVIH